MKGKYIYWKHKGDLTYSKSFVQDIVKTDSGDLLELSDSDLWTNYPTRILESTIDILTSTTNGNK